MSDRWIDEYLEMIEDCEARESRLTDWERGFIDSLRDALDSGRRPSPKQTGILNLIWEKATEQG